MHPSAPRLDPLPLYAGLTTESQMRVFERAESMTRKVIVSTNIAEASVTIDGVRYVVDCGFVKVRFMIGVCFLANTEKGSVDQDLRYPDHVIETHCCADVPCECDSTCWSSGTYCSRNMLSSLPRERI